MSLFQQAVETALLALGNGKAPRALRSLVTFAGKALAVRSARFAEVATDDPEIGGNGGLGKLEMLVGLPGVKLNPAAGGRVRVGFEAGSHQKAEVTAYEQDRTADRAVARKSDRVLIGSITSVTTLSTPPSTTVTINLAPNPITGEAAQGSPIVIVFAGTLSFRGLIPLGPDTFPLYAWIDTGSPEVSLRHYDTEEIP